VGVGFREDERIYRGGIMSEIVSVPGCYLEGPSARRSERPGADLPEAGMLDRTEYAVVEGSDDRVAGHVPMIDKATDAARGERARS
jgi:hypothetical protein